MKYLILSLGVMLIAYSGSAETLLKPLEIREEMESQMETHPESDTGFSEKQIAILTAENWQERVGEGLGIWISVEDQKLYIVRNRVPVWQGVCATAAAGTGEEEDSLKTPRGWHRVAQKFGHTAPWGQVFRSRRPTEEIWKPGQGTDEDLVLTRILWLEGQEPGVNKGKNANGVCVDSRKRFIYIHGTNGEHQLGTPSSHGCIRLSNDDVIEVFERVPEQTPVLISESDSVQLVRTTE